MSGKLCPQCKNARDFFVDSKFDVCCGYCGFTVANVKDQFKAVENRIAEQRTPKTRKDLLELKNQK
ncbi:hypothetical protein [Vibrio sp. THAF190c]|jgi:ribosomal protein S27E|uniref:hypothetical protein n=1 Tax=Vibrio sp. THAF190c TaxID=2587865 RepID=UPI0012686DA2|nr:hypothetical protein [Vibrio sp. THAF190c]QFT13368.1 hypothetical protein FIV04_25795 [Vibrio sp. THAF190c]